MSVKIRVSYEQEHELWDVLDHLEPLGIEVKRAPEAGRYKRAYITVRPVMGIPTTNPVKKNANGCLTNHLENGIIAPVE